ncbi:small acid-soluble spore protein SspI [Domibacillus sp. 8LH]|uniref:small acid-soluble spore protein SspI n=1 Tax=Domibacillus TaxID=1433999 RepID=UPI00203B5242|nr:MULTISPECIES: small acid-soluble spore protein SspI [Domibacillus]MCM3786933.1 small acid-soluble spore protein SspI [Domibacillus indicus]WNS81764.1 small acid-soluble spore protein SspI [Domibacillus sp. DTU_2020_1001157_1_SI_ALB_TIR_016]
MDLRGAIIQNLNGQNPNELSAVIQDAISNGEEKTLPGLGVMLELFWKKSTTEEQKVVLERMASALQ